MTPFLELHSGLEPELSCREMGGRVESSEPYGTC